MASFVKEFFDQAAAMTTADSPIRFHWSMSSAGDVKRRAGARTSLSAIPSLDVLVRFCRQAEECGIESLLTAYGSYRPDPIAIASAIGVQTSAITFMVAIRSGVSAPAQFVQQVNTVAAITNGRISLNIVNGHTAQELNNFGDFLDHAGRYERTDEFLTVCHAFWESVDGVVNFEGKHYRVQNGRLNSRFVAPDRTRPYVFLGGNSDLAETMALKHADCLWRFGNTIETIAPSAARLRGGGKELGLVISMIARPTRDKARRYAEELIAGMDDARRMHADNNRTTDSVGIKQTYELAEKTQWPAETLWTGAVPYMGPPSVAIVGSYDDVAAMMIDYKAAGVSQFLLLGWPDFEEMRIFADEVAPRVRALEAVCDQASVRLFPEPAPAPMTS